MIRLEHVTKEFSSSNKKVIAVNDVSVHISKGEIYGIIGFSGAGKSTLFGVSICWKCRRQAKFILEIRS